MMSDDELNLHAQFHRNYHEKAAISDNRLYIAQTQIIVILTFFTYVVVFAPDDVSDAAKL